LFHATRNCYVVPLEILDKALASEFLWLIVLQSREVRRGNAGNFFIPNRPEKIEVGEDEDRICFGTFRHLTAQDHRFQPENREKDRE
jgi:hypothetical protein